MGNRAVITTPERKIGLYLRWNGGRDTVEPLLRYCELKGYRPPSLDTYGWARMAQVMGNFFGGTLSIGIGTYTTDERMDPGDNGIYVIDGWRIVERLRAKHDGNWRPVGTEPIPAEDEQGVYDFDEMLHALDRSMPETERLGAFLDSEELPTSELSLGDEVWVREIDDSFKPYPVVAFADDGTPLVGRYDRDGDWSWNPNNRVVSDTVRVASRG